MNGFVLLVIFSFSDIVFWRPVCQTVISPDTTIVSDTSNSFDEIDLKPRFYPGSFYSNTYGFGIGVGIEVQNAVGSGSSLLFAVRPAEHRGLYSASLYTADPYESSVFGFLSVLFGDTGRQRFWGLGPYSSRSNLVYVERKYIEVETRLGLRPHGTQLILQPGLQFVYSNAIDYQIEGNLSDLDPASIENLQSLLSDQNDEIPGVAIGFETALDSRDSMAGTRHGMLLQATAYRWWLFTRQVSAYNRFSLSSYGFIPISRKGTLALRAVLMLTRAQPRTDIPFFFLPRLDRRLIPGFPSYRFYDRDVLVFGAEYRHHLLNILDLTGIEVLFSLNAGSVYQNVFNDFAASVSLKKDLRKENPVPSLRPTAGLGFRLFSASADRVYFTGMLGLSAEGFSLLTFRFVSDLYTSTSILR